MVQNTIYQRSQCVFSMSSTYFSLDDIPLVEMISDPVILFIEFLPWTKLPFNIDKKRYMHDAFLWVRGFLLRVCIQMPSQVIEIKQTRATYN